MLDCGWVRCGAVALAISVASACRGTSGAEESAVPNSDETRRALARSERVGQPQRSNIPSSQPATAPATFAEDGELVIWSAGLAKQLEDPRDAGVLRALSMADERMLELVEELDVEGMPPGTIELVCDLLRSPSCLRLEILDDQPVGFLPLPFRVQWTVRGENPEAVQAMTARVESLLALAMPPATVVERRPDLRLVQSPIGNLYYGKTEEGDFVLSLGEPWARWPETGAFALADGVDPVLAFGFDVTTFLRTAMSLGGSQAEQGRAMLETAGLLGEEPYMFQFVAGHASDRAVYAVRHRNWVPVSRASKSLVTEPLTREELGLVPADVTVASLNKADLGSVLAWLEMSQQRYVAEDAIREHLGLDLENDLLEPVGTTFALYLSQATGGGGMASAVFVAALDDQEHFERTLDVLFAKLEAEIASHTPGRARLRLWDHGGTPCRSLVFPGLPIPLEVSLAITRGRLFAAATPTGLVAALDQAARGDGGLLAHPALSGLGSLDDLQSLTFHDSPRLLEEGYGYATLLCSALANAVRSASDGTREPGLVLPTYHELREGARPLVLLARIQGDDLVTAGEADRSAVASVTAFLGWLPNLIGVFGSIGALASIGEQEAMGELEQALDASEMVRARADIMGLESALMQYALENSGRYPDSLDALGVPDENGMSFLDEPGPYLDPWGNPYRYVAPTEGEDPHVFSLGADGLPGGDGSDADIDNLQDDYEVDEDEGYR